MKKIKFNFQISLKSLVFILILIKKERNSKMNKTLQDIKMEFLLRQELLINQSQINLASKCTIFTLNIVLIAVFFHF
jgi:hypothetical protein